MYLRLSTIRSRFYAADHRGINAWKDPVTPFTFLSRGFIDRITRKCTNALELLALLQCFTTFTRWNTFYFASSVLHAVRFPVCRYGLSSLKFISKLRTRIRVSFLCGISEKWGLPERLRNGEVSWIFRLRLSMPTYCQRLPSGTLHASRSSGYFTYNQSSPLSCPDDHRIDHPPRANEIARVQWNEQLFAYNFTFRWS